MTTDIQGRFQTSYTTPYNGAISHGAKIGVFGLLPTTHVETNANKMRPQLCAAFHASQYIHTWRITVILIMGKTRRPPIWALCWDKNGAGSGISLVYLWKWHTMHPNKRRENLMQFHPNVWVWHSVLIQQKCQNVFDSIVFIQSELCCKLTLGSTCNCLNISYASFGEKKIDICRAIFTLISIN